MLIKNFIPYKLKKKQIFFLILKLIRKKKLVTFSIVKIYQSFLYTYSYHTYLDN